MTDKRIVKTKFNLRNSLSILLASKNYSDISVEMICQQALCSRSTFYVYYNGKDELVQTLVEEYINEFSKYLNNRLKVSKSTDFIDIMHLISQEFLQPRRNSILNLLKSAEIANYFLGKLEYIFQQSFNQRYPNKPSIVGKLYAINAASILKMLIKNEISADDLKTIAQIQENILE
ncbi:TetR/AcrR family transcriptional regulator [Companilactobacillus musae]|uniref:TetR/AcrR family transcriptional regulator n=1 Tax=Companilactobacillus musae TaxID=1903258 RepID=UPI000E65D016|nr:TetR/AcrR family transcriptional regulator [Companilactobacillus musae]